MYRISPGIAIPRSVLRLDASTDAPSLCVLARNADSSGRSARTYDSRIHARKLMLMRTIARHVTGQRCASGCLGVEVIMGPRRL